MPSIKLPVPVERLVYLLGDARPTYSDYEDDWTQNLFEFIAKHTEHDVWFDDSVFDNLLVEIPKSDGTRSRVLWTAHTDTVAQQEGRQKVRVSASHFAYLHVSEKAQGCLGADCTTGVWLMLNMILSDVPGTYAFFRAEEVGRLGSKSALSEETIDPNDFDFCISFDRHSYNSVITHQSGRRCCSDAFAKSIGEQIFQTPKLDTGGSYTDSYTFLSVIPECTNISVGYKSQHSVNEMQDLKFAEALAHVLIHIDEDKFVVKRDPTAVEPSLYSQGNVYAYSGYSNWLPSKSSTKGHAGAFQTMEQMVEGNPGIVADLLRQLGYDDLTLRDEINGYGLSVPDSETDQAA